ncbi:MAG: hypothetical protein HMLIMOIP_002311 [Candidatus Nitrosomirales archaeon]|jgi:hypothetical protein
MNKTLIIITLCISEVAGVVGAVIPVFAAIQCCYFEDTPPELLRVSPSYGFITHEPEDGLPDDFSFDSRASIKWTQSDTSLNVNYQTNLSGVSGISQDEARTQIQNAENNWSSVLSSSSKLPNFVYQQDTSNTPSLLKTECAAGVSTVNSINEIGFCNIAAGGLVQTSGVRLNQTTNTIVEADMVLNDGFWTSSQLYNATLHEFGHWYGLGDLYKSYACETYEINDPVMCIQDFSLGTLQWGDKDGIRWLYPIRYSFGLSAVNIITGADAAVAQIDSSCPNPDLLAVWGDYSGAGVQTTIKARVLWDLDSITGARTTTGTIQSLVTVSGQTYDVGATLYKVDADQAYDLIITYTVPFSGTSITYYMIFWDITRSGSCGSSFTYSGTAGPYTVPFTAGDRGTDVAVFDIDGDITRDLVVTDSYLLGSSYTFWYYYGALSGAGTVSTWHTGISSGEFSVPTEDVGFSRPYSFVNALSFKPASGDTKQHFLHFNTADSSIDYSITNKFGPLRSQGSLTGFGAGDAINLGEQSTNEMFFVWTNTSTGYYVIEWDSKINSHG